MMNVLTRALARSSDTTTVGKVFNAYEPTYGLQPDVDTYNAVLESCESHAKVGAVNGMLALMSSRGVAPNTVSWNLLLSTSIRAGEGGQRASWARGEREGHNVGGGAALVGCTACRVFVLANRCRMVRQAHTSNRCLPD